MVCAQGISHPVVGRKKLEFPSYQFFSFFLEIAFSKYLTCVQCSVTMIGLYNVYSGDHKPRGQAGATAVPEALLHDRHGQFYAGQH